MGVSCGAGHCAVKCADLNLAPILLYVAATFRDLTTDENSICWVRAGSLITSKERVACSNPLKSSMSLKCR